ncbi:MAG: DUF721 domain-containing protein [Acidimicrobiia bacterium]|nr:DUF721 domain-containing protein [Acidimicrobiia bacterium]
MVTPDRAAWRNREPVGDAAMPTRLGDALDSVVTHLAGGRARSGSLVARWAELVGPDVAEHASLVALRDGELVVSVRDPLWATQLRWLEADVLRRVEAGGGPRLDRLTVRVRTP